MRNYRATDNKIAVSLGTKETAINTWAAPDTTLMLDAGALFTITPKTEDNKEEMTGYEEATRVYNLGQTAEVTFPFTKAQPHHIGFLAAYALGKVVTVAAGATGYLHTFTNKTTDEDINRSNPSFSSMMKYSDVFKGKFFSNFVDSLTLTFTKESWVKASANIKATGKVTENWLQESITETDDATALSLSENAVHGATADERLSNIHQIIAETSTGVWEEVVYSAVSDAEPAVITIESVGGDGDSIAYKILYIPDESTDWTFPAMIDTESPMRTTDTVLNIGGKWNGSSFVGGRSYTCEIKSVDWTYTSGVTIEQCFGVPGGYAARQWRDAKSQTLKIDKEMRDVIMKAKFANEESFALHIKNEGAEYETGHKYTVELILPKIQIINPSMSVDGKKLSESIEFAVLQDATYGSCILRTKDQVAAYAA